MSEITRICHICLSPILNETYSKLSDKLQMFQIVLSPLKKLHQSHDSVLCGDCCESLRHSFEFKTECLENENCLKTMKNEQNLLPKDSIVKLENELKCRLCFNYFKNNFFTHLNRIEDDIFLMDMFTKCLPEINLNCTKNSVMCDNCNTSLQIHFNLLTTYLDTNEKISDYVSITAANNEDGEIDLREVLAFASNVKSERDDYAAVTIKSEIDIDVNELSVVDVKVEEECNVDRDPSFGRISPKEQSEKASLEANADGLYVCNQCSHTTTRKDSLLLHFQTHQDVFQYKCNKCDFVSKWRSSLSQHLPLHLETSQKKKYSCPSCKYETKYPTHLKRHSKRHKAKVTYKCQYCSFTSTNRYYFRLHNRSKHGKSVTFENNFACSQCDYVTDKQFALAQHRSNAHKKYVCDCCGYKTNRLWHFQEHSLKHKNDGEVNMLECDKCHFKTKYKSSLIQHITRHYNC